MNKRILIWAVPSALLALASTTFLMAEKKAGNGEATGCSSCSCAMKAKSSDAESWALKGVVESVMAERNSLLVKHEEIPGFMAEMTMLFQVDPSLLDQVQVGDNITAIMKRGTERGWLLEDVEILDS